MNLIWKYVRPQWALACLAPLFVLLEVWAELAQPDLMSHIVDEGILGGHADMIGPTGLKMFIIMLVGVVGGLLSIVAAGRVSFCMSERLRADVYQRVSSLAFADVDRLETASLITRLGSDVSRIQQVVQASMRLLFRAPFLFVGAVVMALMINVHVSIIIISLMVACFFFVLKVMRRTFPLFMALQQRRDRLTAVVQEMLSGVRVTKAYTNEWLEDQKFSSANDELTADSIRVGKFMACMMPVVSFALNAGTVLVIYFGAREVVVGGMNVGGIMAAINYLAQIQIAVMMAQHVIMNITQAQASIQRINEVLLTPSQEEQDALQQFVSRPFANGDISISNVSFAYGATANPNANSPSHDTSAQPQLTLSNITCHVRQGETLAILGQTGSGKTTLASLLARFYDVASGSITIGSVDIRDIDRADLQRHVVMVLQTPLLFSGTLRSNLTMGRPSATDSEIMSAAHAVGIDDFINSQPLGLDHVVEQAGRNLSGGQRQRLCIARALIMNPDVLILDDCLCALDNITERFVREQLMLIPCTKVIVSQRITSVMHANNILMLHQGQVLAQGTHAQLMNSCPEYRETYIAQTQEGYANDTLPNGTAATPNAPLP